MHFSREKLPTNTEKLGEGGQPVGVDDEGEIENVGGGKAEQLGRQPSNQKRQQMFEQAVWGDGTRAWLPWIPRVDDGDFDCARPARQCSDAFCLEPDRVLASRLMMGDISYLDNDTGKAPFLLFAPFTDHDQTLFISSVNVPGLGSRLAGLRELFSSDD